MTTRVEFFGALREVVGAHELEFSLPDGATVAEVIAAVRTRCAAAQTEELIVMAGLDYVETSHRIRPGEVISLLPPGASR